MPSLREVALHEAGHAVVGEVGGNRCEELTILPKDGALGYVTWPAVPEIVELQLGGEYTRHGEPEWDELKSWVDARVKSSLAGALTEQRITGDFNWDGAKSDLESIGQFVVNVYGYEGPDHDEALCPVMLRDPQMGVELEDWSAVIARVRELWDDEVEALITEHWDWIEAVAILAVWKKTITGDQVRAAQPSAKTTMTLAEVREAE
jgi:hypothetical protein